MSKPLPPTQRERNRYLVFRVDGAKGFERNAIVDAIWGSHLGLYGQVGAAKTSLWIMDWEKDRGSGIAKVNHKSTDMIRSSMALVKKIENKDVTIHTLLLCSTLKKARQNL